MVDINTYRSRIGRFSPKFSDKKYLLRRDFYKQASWNEKKFGEKTLSVIIFVLKLVTWLIIFQDFSLQFKSESYLATSGQSDINQLTVISPAIDTASLSGVIVLGASLLVGAGTGYRGARGENIQIKQEIIDHNFEARYKNGNIQKKKGILNMHLNIRSL